MKRLLLLPLLLGFSVPAIAHNEANGGSEGHQPICVGHPCGPTDEKAAKLRAKELKEGSNTPLFCC